jgi:predicted  nucleic acid-binding Zn-ribbon protein
MGNPQESHHSVPQTPVGLTLSDEADQLRKDLQRQRLESNKLGRALAESQKEVASLKLLLENANRNQEKLEKKLTKGLKALAGDCVLFPRPREPA